MSLYRDVPYLDLKTHFAERSTAMTSYSYLASHLLHCLAWFHASCCLQVRCMTSMATPLSGELIRLVQAYDIAADLEPMRCAAMSI